MDDRDPYTSATPAAEEPVLPDKETVYSDPRYKLLSGAGKKRMWRLLQSGLSLEDAISQAKLSSRHSEGLKQNPKRSGSETNSLEDDLQKAPEKSTIPVRQDSNSPNRDMQLQPVRRGTNPPHRNSDAVRVGIRNVEPMTDAEMSLVRASLLQTLCVEGQFLDSRGKGPKFLGFSHKAGWILVTCENQRSKDWLATVVSHCKPWPGARLSIMKDSDLPKPWIATTFIPSTEASSVERALDIIRYQNEGLYPEHWRVLHEKSEGGGIVAVFSLDEVSVEALRASRFRVNIGFRKMVFKVKGENKSGHSSSVTTKPGLIASGARSIDQNTRLAASTPESIWEEDRSADYLWTDQRGQEEWMTGSGIEEEIPNPSSSWLVESTRRHNSTAASSGKNMRKRTYVNSNRMNGDPGDAGEGPPRKYSLRS